MIDGEAMRVPCFAHFIRDPVRWTVRADPYLSSRAIYNCFFMLFMNWIQWEVPFSLFSLFGGANELNVRQIGLCSGNSGLPFTLHSLSTPNPIILFLLSTCDYRKIPTVIVQKRNVSFSLGNADKRWLAGFVCALCVCFYGELGAKPFNILCSNLQNLMKVYLTGFTIGAK